MFQKICVVVILLCVIPLAEAQAQSSPPDPAESDFPPPAVYVSTGSTGQVLVITPDPDNPGQYLVNEVATGKGGFRPEEVAFGADGLYVCDQSNSEIYRVGLDGSIVTLYERDTASSPYDPEQPAGCTLRASSTGVGTDLLFISRRGRGKNYKTGIWRLENVVGATDLPIVPDLPLPLDDPDTGNDLAVAPDGDVYFTFGNQIFAIDDFAGPNQTVSEFTQAPLLGEGFGIAINDIGGDFEVYAASRYQGVIEGFDSNGRLCTSIMYPGGDEPRSMEFDITGDMWSVAAQRSNGRVGSVYKADTPSCDDGGQVLNAAEVALDASVGVALGPNAGTATIAVGAAGKSATADLCTTLFNVDPFVFNGPSCSVNLTCRIFELSEFADRTLIPPAIGTSCVPLAGSGGSFCAEMRISVVDSNDEPSPQCIEDVITNWFLTLEPNTPVFRPGLLYSPGPQNGDGSFNPFFEDIFTSINLLVDPSNPDDPRYTGSRDELGSGIVAVNGVENKAPTADAGEDQTIPICTVPTYLTLTGSATDPDEGVEWRTAGGIIDLMEGPGYDFQWSGPNGFSAVGQSVDIDVSGFADGTYTYTLDVTDKPNDGVTAKPAVPDTIDVTIVNEPPTIGQVDVTPSVLWPPSHKLVDIAIDIVELNDACGGTVADPNAACRIKSVMSDDPVNGSGDGNTEVDWVINEVAGGGTTWGDLALQVMSERSEAGTDRIYTVTLECIDALDRLATKEVYVRVSDNQGGGN